MDYSSIIISLLEKYEIEYWEEGPNCTAKAINIKCPFCDDASSHHGIFRDFLNSKCWKCGRKSNLGFILATITGRSQKACWEEIKASGISFDLDSEQQIKNIFEEELVIKPKKLVSLAKLPKPFQPIEEVDSILLDNYLCRRNLTREVLVEHQCGVCLVGDYMNRLIIPVIFEGKLVGFQAADMTGRSDTSYKADRKDSEIKNYFYRWDRINQDLDFIVVVEGVVDAWRLRGNTLCSFGTALSENQKRLLIKFGPKKLIFCPDGDAYSDTLIQSEYFTPFIDEVHVVQLPYRWKNFSERVNEDPDSFGAENVWNLIKEECFAV